MRAPQIAVIGAGEVEPAVAHLAEQLGCALIDAGWRIVCGGRGGVMEAAARGAHQSERATGADVIGILPTTEASSANPWVDVVIPTGLGHARNTVIVASADAVVAVGGRSGTLSEIALAWSLGKPIVALTVAGRPLDDRRTEPIVAADSVPGVIAALHRLLEA